MSNRVRLLVFTVLLFSVPVFADSISIGYISILADSPNNGEQQLTISNLTGDTNCVNYGPPYSACTSLDFTNWTLTVTYTSDYYNGTGPAEPDPFVFTDSGSGPYGGFGDITPSSANNVFDFDLCAGLSSCTNPDDPDTQITSVEFSGQISPSSFCLYDATVPGCNTEDPDTFFADPNFDMVWTNSSPGGSPYVDEDLFPYAQSPDITVSDEIPPSTSAPEPSTFSLLTAILPFAWFVRRSKSKRTI
jgi:hypothetical protein